MKNITPVISLPKPKNNAQYGMAAISFICIVCLKPILRIGPLAAIVWLLFSSALIYELGKTSSPSEADLAREARELKREAEAYMRGHKRQRRLAS